MNGRSILLVDDSDLVAEMVKEALEEGGYKVIRARDGYEAIELCYRAVPDIIVMDIDMPLLKGYQASRLLKTRRGVKSIPIVMHTANSEDKDRFWSYDSGACAFVVKDFEHIGPLIETVGEFIRHDPPDLAAIQEDAKVDILHACGGNARCTTCRIEFIEGEPTTHTAAEAERLAARALTGVRLACQILCDHDMTVRAISRLEGSGRPDPGPMPQEAITPPAQWV